MKERYPTLAILILFFSVNSPAATNFTEDCHALLQSKLPSTTLSYAELQPSALVGAGKNSALTGASANQEKVGKHCLVTGVIGARRGVDNREYGTHFELRMPENWNGGFLFQGGGGMDGVVAPAVGGIPFHNSTARPALNRGYAVVSMDGGHQGNNADFGTDQAARIDYAYASIGKVTSVAKALINSFYHSSPGKSLFMGCSNGGREAMIAAQRYPNEFDGIIAGNPGFRLSKASLGQAWDTQQLIKIAPPNAQGKPILANALAPQDLNLVSRAVLAACDAKDGIKDGLINNWVSAELPGEALFSFADHHIPRQ
ncbi:tannase/feruloyl esterase family alpha/beta hydrolase [Brenneria uluponensis]|uniref:tannase/feruloyl esterase family alpha/beta hydrolase n=1 Tax=Brenneria uluponensis TaxID=3057057 RepID=UPI0028E5A211|nr:tannase/feruloyl esterase family alpha/beta hydrolase [Brenneria ulupoensis]